MKSEIIAAIITALIVGIVMICVLLPAAGDVIVKFLVIVIAIGVIYLVTWGIVSGIRDD